MQMRFGEYCRPLMYSCSNHTSFPCKCSMEDKIISSRLIWCVCNLPIKLYIYIYINYNHNKYKKYKNNSVKPNDFYAKKKNVSKKHDKQMTGKGKCFNCGKPGHFSKDCNQKPGKLKNKFNMLKINDKDIKLYII